MSEPFLSLAMIVKDEEETIGLILHDVQSLCDEIVVVDTGSSDATVEVAERFGARVAYFDWIDDFSAARNYSFSLCHGEWILWLDADDRVEPSAVEGLHQIRGELSHLEGIDAVNLPYRYAFSPPDSDFCVTSLDRVRIIRNDPSLRWVGVIHEAVSIEPDRMINRPDVRIDHRPTSHQMSRKEGRNREILERAVAQGERSARNLEDLGLEFLKAGRVTEAKSLYEEALTLPSSTDSHYHTLCSLSICANSLGDSGKRTEYLTQAIAVNPDRAEAFLMLGDIFFERQDWARALPFFSAATAVDRPTMTDDTIFEPGYSWYPWDRLSTCATALGKFADAVEYAYRALPGNPERDRLITEIQANLRHVAEREDRRAS